jgi:hypothetical protein
MSQVSIIDDKINRRILDPNDLILVCESNNLKYIEKLLQHKITPTNSCFKAIFKSHTFHNYIRFMQTKYILSLKVDIACQAVELLISYGYKITYDDVVYALTHGCYIDSINRFNIKLDKNFNDQCIKYSYFPYDDNGMNIDNSELYIACDNKKSIKEIKSIIKNKGIKPDQACIQRACKHNTNIQVIRYFIEQHGLYINRICLDNVQLHCDKTSAFILENIVLKNE